MLIDIQSLLSIQFSLAAIVNFLLLLAFHKWGLNRIPPGPFSLILSLLDQYYRIMPTLFNFRILGLPFSNNFQVYLLATIVRYPNNFKISLSSLITFSLQQPACLEV
jgi:hypothetical protein